jgi:hypothetical protein
MKTKTYWVEYTYEYQYVNGITGEIEFETDYGSGRFTCRKRDIKKEVIKRIREEWVEDLSIKIVENFKVTITDCYETTEFEI